MTNWKKKTVETYDKSAKQLAEYFRGIGSRDEDIKQVFDIVDLKNPKVLEIGCGDGRDAKTIVQLTNDYIGFDVSEGLIKLAREHVPGAKFEIADAVTYGYPGNLDIVFAFASLLHVDKDDLKNILRKLHKSMKPGGVVFISLKYRPLYTEEVKVDRFGERMFYYYNPELIEELAGHDWEVTCDNKGFVTVGNTEWFEVVLKKVKR